MGRTERPQGTAAARCHLHGQHRVTSARSSTRCHLCWPHILPYKASAEAAAGYLWSLTLMGLPQPQNLWGFPSVKHKHKNFLFTAGSAWPLQPQLSPGSQHTWISSGATWTSIACSCVSLRLWSSQEVDESKLWNASKQLSLTWAFNPLF